MKLAWPMKTEYMSKWISEQVWLEAMEAEDSRIRHLSEHAWYDKRGVLDASYKAQLIHEAQRRRDRILQAGDPNWRQRYERLQTE